MEIPTPEVQTGLYGLLGFIGTGLSAIAVGLYKLLMFFIEQAKAEGKAEGELSERLKGIEKAIEKLDKDLGRIAFKYLQTPKSLNELSEEEKEKLKQ